MEIKTFEQNGSGRAVQVRVEKEALTPGIITLGGDGLATGKS